MLGEEVGGVGCAADGDGEGSKGMVRAVNLKIVARS